MNAQPNAMVIHTFDIIYVIFFMHPYLIELIRGADMDMMLNHFCVFLYSYTPNFTRHKIYIFICVFKKTKLMSIFQTFVPQYMI